MWQSYCTPAAYMTSNYHFRQFRSKSIFVGVSSTAKQRTSPHQETVSMLTALLTIAAFKRQEILCGNGSLSVIADTYFTQSRTLEFRVGCIRVRACCACSCPSDLKWAQLVRAIWENAFCFGSLLRQDTFLVCCNLGSDWLKTVIEYEAPQKKPKSTRYSLDT